jgi:hypothetical protein
MTYHHHFLLIPALDKAEEEGNRIKAADTLARKVQQEKQSLSSSSTFTLAVTFCCSVQARIYEALKQGNVSGESQSFLVDFEQKTWDERDRKDAAGARAVSSTPGLEFGGEDRLQAKLNAAVYDMADERERWEGAALAEIKGEEPHRKRAQALYGVKQQMHKMLTPEERAMLKQVSQETEDARNQAMQVKVPCLPFVTPS